MGNLEVGGTVVEASSGNTAMGLAMMGILEGVQVKIVVRKETSPEKLATLRALGVDLVLVDGERSPDDPAALHYGRCGKSRVTQHSRPAS